MIPSNDGIDMTMRVYFIEKLGLSYQELFLIQTHCFGFSVAEENLVAPEELDKVTIFTICSYGPHAPNFEFLKMIRMPVS